MLRCIITSAVTALALAGPALAHPHPEGHGHGHEHLGPIETAVHMLTSPGHLLFAVGVTLGCAAVLLAVAWRRRARRIAASSRAATLEAS